MKIRKRRKTENQKRDPGYILYKQKRKSERWLDIRITFCNYNSCFTFLGLLFLGLVSFMDSVMAIGAEALQIIRI